MQYISNGLRAVGRGAVVGATVLAMAAPVYAQEIPFAQVQRALYNGKYAPLAVGAGTGRAQSVPGHSYTPKKGIYAKDGETCSVEYPISLRTGMPSGSLIECTTIENGVSVRRHEFDGRLEVISYISDDKVTGVWVLPDWLYMLSQIIGKGDNYIGAAKVRTEQKALNEIKERVIKPENYLPETIPAPNSLARPHSQMLEI